MCDMYKTENLEGRNGGIGLTVGMRVTGKVRRKGLEY
jgi:hypothetical protein